MAHLGFSDCWGSTSSAVDALFTQQNNGSLERAVGDFRVVRVDEASPLLPEVIDVITRSECVTTTTAPDPLLDWVYSARTQGVCGPLPKSPSSERVAWFRWLSTYCVHFAISRGGLYALVDPDSGHVVAAAATGPPRTVSFCRMSGEEMGINIRRAGMSLAPEILCHNLRMKSLGMWQYNSQEKFCPGGNYLYVVMFATRPEWQGRGCGSALLRFLGDVADADGVVSFLETAGCRNTSFYSKKGGYQEVERSPIATFEHEGGAVAMRRSPQQSNVNNNRSNTGRPCNNTPCRPCPSRAPSSSGSCDHQFSPKLRYGPLASYCRVCDGHRSKHEQ